MTVTRLAEPAGWIAGWVVRSIPVMSFYGESGHADAMLAGTGWSVSVERKVTMNPERVFPAVILLGLLGNAVAEPSYAAGMTAQKYSAGYDTCMDKSGGVTAEMLDCASTELALQDKKLNAAYQALMRKSTDEEKNALRDSQRGWLAYRTASCKLTLVFGGGGTMDLISASSCNLDETARRVFFLESLLAE